MQPHQLFNIYLLNRNMRGKIVWNFPMSGITKVAPLRWIKGWVPNKIQNIITCEYINVLSTHLPWMKNEIKTFVRGSWKRKMYLYEWILKQYRMYIYRMYTQKYIVEIHTSNIIIENNHKADINSVYRSL